MFSAAKTFRKPGLAFIASSLLLLPVRSQQRVEFSRDVQPVLEKSCYNCHGPKAQLGGLRLDSKALAAKSIVAGKSKDSTLYQRIAGVGEQARMPMGGKPLTPDQISVIQRWIDEGADWPEAASVAGAEIKKHWAYVAPVRPALPAGEAENAIDRFVLARLAKEGMKPSAEADRVTLLRRLSLDIVGLPPTPQEVDAFVADKSPKAWEKQVDRLLASVHYGERQARVWLDAARYADSDGFEKDKMRWVWFYRDWVINAFNRNLPYNQFVIDQIAGDLVPNATQDQKVATGFLRNSMINEEGGIDPEQFRMEAMFDRVDAIGKAVLGVTIQCAQCHNHKFDPLTQEEYYKLFAFINNTDESNIAVYTPEERKRAEEIRRAAAAIEAKTPKKAPQSKTEWTVIRPEADDISTGGQKYLAKTDGSLLAAGYAPTKHKVKLTTKASLKGIAAIRLELLNDPNLPLGGPGRSILGTGALSEIEAEVRPAGQADAKPVKLKFVRATADVEVPEHDLEAIYNDKSNKKRTVGPVALAIDGKEETAWTHDAGPVLRNRPRQAVFNLSEPISLDGEGELTIYLSQKHGGWNSDDNQNHNMGRFRLSVTTDTAAAAEPDPTPAEVISLWKKHPEGSSQLVLHEREVKRSTFILARGDFLKPGKEVAPGVPSFLNPLPETEKQPNRLTFARWLVDRRSPTTARAYVNRVWQQYFGQGLVSTPEDLGKQSEAPSHPELLDWLAVEFMESGWDVKKLHRLIVTSATYKQSSAVNQETLSADPYNKLLSHAPRLRVDGEIVRDIALAASGLLSDKVGGPSVYPPAPEFLFLPPTSYGPKNWPVAEGEDRYRRALYTFRFRSVPYPMLQTFDAPNGDMACVRRARSNTPLQALTMLNEPLFVEAAQALALLTIEQGGSTDEQKVNYAFRRVLARAPSSVERDELLSFVGKQRKRMEEGWLSAKNLMGDTKLPSGVTPVQAALWTTLTRTLLSLDEAITKE